MFSYSAHVLSQVRHCKADSFTKIRDKISRTEITHWTASPFEYCLHFIKTCTYKKNLVSLSLLTSSKLWWRAPRVNWPWGQLAVEQNNFKIINLFYKRSPENQTNFQVTFKYYISLGSNRDLGWFGEFPHKENSILVLAVNCCIYKHYANCVSKLCSFVDILPSKSKKIAV